METPSNSIAKHDAQAALEKPDASKVQKEESSKELEYKLSAASYSYEEQQPKSAEIRWDCWRIKDWIRRKRTEGKWFRALPAAIRARVLQRYKYITYNRRSWRCPTGPLQCSSVQQLWWKASNSFSSVPKNLELGGTTRSTVWVCTTKFSRS